MDAEEPLGSSQLRREPGDRDRGRVRRDDRVVRRGGLDCLIDLGLDVGALDDRLDDEVGVADGVGQRRGGEVLLCGPRRALRNSAVRLEPGGPVVALQYKAGAAAGAGEGRGISGVCFAV